MATQDTCEVTPLFHLLSGKWVLPVLHKLHYAPGAVRFSELRRAVPGITTSELSKTLRMLESRGMLVREVFAEVPPRVEYRCTPLALELRDCLEGFAGWLRRNERVLKGEEPR